jgi:lipid-binding SYLF domain-containing protein
MFGRKQYIAGLCLLLLGAAGAYAWDAAQLDAKVADALVEFDKYASNSEELIAKAEGVLVCPKISKVGLGVGIESGNCALQVDGETVEYWKASSASFGLTAGIQSQGMVMAFMTAEALDKFRKSNRGWEAGVTGSVAVMNVGAGGKINTNDIKAPIAAWVFTQKGLMADLSLEGSTYKRIGVVGDDVYGEPWHRFVATAELSSRSNNPSAQMTIDIDCWATQDERAALRDVLQNEGSSGLHAALEAAPACGTVKQPGGEMSIEYAYWTKMPDGNYRVILGSTEPMAFLNPKAQAAKIDENVTVIQLDLNEDRVGTGIVQMGAELAWDDGVVIHADKRTPPVKLSSVSYKKIN